jgi:hypothetical protein
MDLSFSYSRRLFMQISASKKDIIPSAGFSTWFSLAPRKFQCSCGTTIEYIDRVVGGSNAQSAILVCRKCQKEHQITFLGFLSEIRGATLKR